MIERFEGKAVSALIGLDNGSKILLLDPDSERAALFENLISISSEGDILWKAKLPAPMDAFVAIERGSRGVEATTWSGYRLVLDYHSGRKIDRAFVK